jgi:SnoaL-like domain
LIPERRSARVVKDHSPGAKLGVMRDLARNLAFGHNRGAIMEKRSGIDAVHNFWEQVWQSPQNYDAIDELVVEDFVITSGGRRIEGREAFKKWVEDFSATIRNFDSEIVDSFENHDGSRVASTFTITGTNNGAFGTTPDDSPIEMTGIAVSVVRDDGMLVSNQVERNAFEAYTRLTGR